MCKFDAWKAASCSLVAPSFGLNDCKSDHLDTHTHTLVRTSPSSPNANHSYRFMVPADTALTCPQIQMQRSLPERNARSGWTSGQTLRRRVATSATPRLLTLPACARSGSPTKGATRRRRRFPKSLQAFKELALVLLVCLPQPP